MFAQEEGGKKTLINQLENGVCAYWALFKLWFHFY